MIWFIPLCVVVFGFFIWKFYTSDSGSELSENNRIYSEKSKEVKDEMKRLTEKNMEEGVDLRLAFGPSPSMDEHCIVFRKAQKIILKGQEYVFSDIIKYEVKGGQDTKSQTTTMNRSGMKTAFGSSFYENMGDAVKDLTGKKDPMPADASISGKTDSVDIYVNDKNTPVIKLYVYPAQIEILGTTLNEIIARNQSVEASDAEDEEPQVNVSVADELIKLKKLKDEGVLTEEEFLAQKGKLLHRST